MRTAPPIHTVICHRVDAIWPYHPVHRSAPLTSGLLVQWVLHQLILLHFLDVRIRENDLKTEITARAQNVEIDHHHRAVNCIVSRSIQFIGNDRNRVILHIIVMVSELQLHSTETYQRPCWTSFRKSQICTSSLSVWTFVSIESAARIVVIGTSIKAGTSSCRSTRETWVFEKVLTDCYVNLVLFSGHPCTIGRPVQLAASPSASATSSFQHVLISWSIPCKLDKQSTYTDALIESTAATSATTFLISWRWCIEPNASLQPWRCTGQYSFLVSTTAACIAGTTPVSASCYCLSPSTNPTVWARSSFNWSNTRLRTTLYCYTISTAPTSLLDEFPCFSFVDHSNKPVLRVPLTSFLTPRQSWDRQCSVRLSCICWCCEFIRTRCVCVCVCAVCCVFINVHVRNLLDFLLLFFSSPGHFLLSVFSLNWALTLYFYIINISSTSIKIRENSFTPSLSSATYQD